MESWEEIIANEVARRLMAQRAPAKPALLFLSEGESCAARPLWDSAALRRRYEAVCCREQPGADPARFAAAVVPALSMSMLTQLAGGACVSPAAQLAQKALLLGKPLLAPLEGVELLRYRETAAPAYYALYRGMLESLRAAGAAFAPAAELEACLLARAAGEQAGWPQGALEPPAPCAATPPEATACAPGTEHAQPAQEGVAAVPGRLVTEKRLAAACRPGVKRVRVARGALVTALAQDLALARGIALERVDAP